MTINLLLLGAFSITSEGKSLSVTGAKGRLLLACLALSAPGPVSRKYLSTLLWEDRVGEHAQLSLRQELARLRQALSLPDHSEWNEAGGVRLPNAINADVARFQSLVTSRQVTAAAMLYRGELLTGLEVRRPKLRKWLEERRRELERKAIESGMRALRNDIEQSDEETLERVARLLIELDPICELAHQTLIKLKGRSSSSLALEQFQSFTEALRVSGSRDPSEETMLLMRSILQPNKRSRSPSGAITGEDSLYSIKELYHQHDVAAAPPAAPQFPIHHQPSLAILPFVEVSIGLDAKSPLADGLTEEITTALSRLPDLFVTARQSSMVYKGLSVDIRQVAVELGVRYLIEGSVEIFGRELRVNARLVDGRSGLTVWGDIVEAQLTEFRTIRNSIVVEIVGRLLPRLMHSEIQRAFDTPAVNLDAWLHLQRANGHVLFMRNPQWLNEALAELKAALKLYPEYGMARSLLAAVYTWRAVWDRTRRGKLERAAALNHANKALISDSANSFVQINCADTLLYMAGDIDRSLNLLENATADAGIDAHGLAIYANVKRCSGGDPEESIELISQATRRSPRDPRTHRWSHYAAWSYWKMGDYRRMEEAAKNAISLYSDAPQQWIALVCALGLRSKEAEAREAARILRGLLPQYGGWDFYNTARQFYGRRFDQNVERDYRRLAEVLENSLNSE